MPMLQSFSPMKLDYYECTIGIIQGFPVIPASNYPNSTL